MRTEARSDPLPPSAVSELGASLTGTVVTADDPAYNDARRVWNAMVDRRPAAIARCAAPGDVAVALAFARRHDLEVGVRGGGHSVVGHAVPEGGLMIDLTQLRAVSVDRQQRLARVGGGALLGDLDRAALAHGLATTAGNVSHTGVGGLTLGGGMGWLARRLGMACDNVDAYEVVIADGTLLRATQTENADLFWGLRGGGGNFGVVTEFTFRLHPIDDRVLSVDLYMPAEAAAEALEAWATWAPDAAREATPNAWTGTAADWPFLPAELHGRQMAAIGYLWVGDPDAGRALLPEVRAMAPTGWIAAEVVEEMSYLQLQTGNDDPMAHGMRRYWKSHYLRRPGREAIAAFLARGNPAADGIQPNGFLQAYGGAIADVGIGDSAFSHRDTDLEFVVMAGWESPEEDGPRMEAPRRFAAAMAPHASGVYVNGLSDEGAAGTQRAYRPETIARLTALKDRYDPDNVFRHNHNIAPSSG